MPILIKTIVKLIFAALVAMPFWWANKTLDVQPAWNMLLGIVVLLTLVPGRQWERLPRFSPRLWQGGLFLGLFLLTIVLSVPTVTRHPVMATVLGVTWLALLGVSVAYQRPGAAVNLALATISVSVALFLANIAAGVVLARLDGGTAISDAAPVEPEVDPTPAATETAVPMPTDTPTPPPSPTPDPDHTPEPTATPQPERPLAGFGYLEWLQDNGEAAWTHLTAYGPRVNSVAHAYMVDADGNTVYDTILEYNGKGYRGPEVDYEKPDDVYRILIIGDSFVEAIQVDYEKTFQALLQEALSQHNTPQRRYEVVAMGRTGWGTVHEAVYYQVEGYKYNADLVILMFYINDVADNYPRVFYPNINNTNYDFMIEEDEIRILDTNQEPLPPNAPRLLYHALPTWWQQTNLARLFVRLGDPPIPVVTPGGVMTRVHPQFYIYVTEPEVEGYAEAWERTERVLHILASDVARDGAEFVVMPVFLGAEMVQNVSHWFPELVAGWQWDDGLPEQRLGAALADTPALLWPTRPTYEAYAASVGGEVYHLLYLPEDGHFNELGHQLTYEAIYEQLVEAGIVE